MLLMSDNLWLHGALLLGPFILWDVVLYLLRRRGDRSPARRERLLLHFSEEDLARGRQHILKHNRLFLPSRGIAYLGYGALLFGGAGVALERWSITVCGESWLLALPLFWGVVLFGRALLTLPLGAYSEFVIERRAGLSTISLRTWLWDKVKMLLLGWILLSLLCLLFLGVVQGLPQTWPLPAAGVLLLFSAFGLWIKPWIIDPLFNTFKPLTRSALATQIRELSARAGLAAEQVYVMDASRRAKYLNAYFTGLGNSRRVVLYDTLVEACPEEEILSVVAHELGHWRGRHLLKGFILQALGIAGGLLLLQLLWDSPPGRGFFGLNESSLLAVLPLVSLLSSLTGTLTAPLGAVISRRFERESDQVALELTGDGDAFVALERRLVREAQADLLGHRLIHFWYGSHPLPEERIAAAGESSGLSATMTSMP